MAIAIKIDLIQEYVFICYPPWQLLKTATVDIIISSDPGVLEYWSYGVMI
jgi:hypothetical protein